MSHSIKHRLSLSDDGWHLGARDSGPWRDRFLHGDFVISVPTYVDAHGLDGPRVGAEYLDLKGAEITEFEFYIVEQDQDGGEEVVEENYEPSEAILKAILEHYVRRL